METIESEPSQRPPAMEAVEPRGVRLRQHGQRWLLGIITTVVFRRRTRRRRPA